MQYTIIKSPRLNLGRQLEKINRILKNRTSIVVLIFIVLALVCLFFYSSVNPASNVRVATALVDRGDIVSSVTANGTLEPDMSLEVYSDLNGIIKSIFFDINSRIKKGDVLAIIEPDQFKIQLKEAQAKYNEASAELKLNESSFNSDEILYQKSLISKQEYETSKTKYQSALALFHEATTNIESARQNLDKTKIKAPIDGIVLSKNVSPGQMVKYLADSGPLFTIASDLKKLTLIIHVSEADTGKTSLGQSVNFKVSAYPEELFSGKVTKISHSPNKDKDIVTYDVTAEVDNSKLKLKPGMTAEVKIIISDKKDVIRVPTSALRFIPNNISPQESQFDNTQSVWIRDSNGKVTKKPVDIGISNNEFSEILNNSLREGQEVVVESYSDNKNTKSILTLPQPKRF